MWGPLPHSVGARLERRSKACFSYQGVGKTSKASFSYQGVGDPWLGAHFTPSVKCAPNLRCGPLLKMRKKDARLNVLSKIKRKVDSL